MTEVPSRQAIIKMDDEQLPIVKHKLHGIDRFFGLYGAEHVVATEFVFGATFVALGVGLWDVLIGLIIGSTLAIRSFTPITAKIATDTRLSLYTYLARICGTGTSTSKLYNAVHVLIFGIISAAIISVSATGVTAQLALPPQIAGYPTSIWFVVSLAIVVVLVAPYRFEILTEFTSICAPLPAVMFTTGGRVLIPALAKAVTGETQVSLAAFLDVANSTVWKGLGTQGKPSIGLWGARVSRGPPIRFRILA